MLLSPTIIFPNLGIEIENLRSGFQIGSFRIATYGIVIAVAVILAVLLCMLRAKRTNQRTDDYIDITIITIFTALIGARIYYVIFSLDQYKDNWLEVFNIRGGGLAIYGGIIAGVLTIFFVCKYKKTSFLRAMDTIVPGAVLAQGIGRWGNFFNMEAYGGFTGSLFAMQIKKSVAGGVITEELLEKMVYVDGEAYIQVHPTFLYESAWCILLCIILLIFTRVQQYNGQVLLWYLGGYAIERAFVEGLRTDQLRIGETIAASQLLSVALLAGAFVILLINRIRIWSGSWKPDFRLVLEDGEPGTVEFYNRRKAEKKKKAGSEWETYTVSGKTEEERSAESGLEETAGKAAAVTAEETAEKTAVETAEKAAETAKE
ncbi:MAG: prolipoprotein diacylglyceryl transferase [Lachnospiraceae bacterium]|jgi:phosphatidylglycerol:prolipoprotein diacylglycerol transferase